MRTAGSEFMNGTKTAPMPEFATDSEYVGTDEADWIVLPEGAEAASSLEGEDLIIDRASENGIEVYASEAAITSWAVRGTTRCLPMTVALTKLMVAM
jgi:hypothetical protein